MDRIIVVVAGTAFGPVKDYLKSTLPEAEVRQVELKELDNHLPEADVLVPMMTRISDRHISLSPRLKLIQQWGSGLEGVDKNAATGAGVAVANVPTKGMGNAESVAEWCIMAAIAMSRQYPKIEKHVSQGQPWGWPCGLALKGKTAGIIGFGGIGREVAVRLRPFGMKLVAIKRDWERVSPQDYGLEWIAGADSLSRLLTISNYIFLCLPLSNSNINMLGAEELALTPEGAFLINPSRGGLIDRSALKDALEEGKIGGVALDVYWEEPTQPGDPFFSKANVFCTPHIAGVTDLSYEGITKGVVDNIKRVIVQGELPLNCANPGVVLKNI